MTSYGTKYLAAASSDVLETRIRAWIPDNPDGPWQYLSASSPLRSFNTALTAYFRPVLGWLRAYLPIGNLGGTILLYRFHEPPDYDVRGPDRPAAPCDGDVSHR